MTLSYVIIFPKIKQNVFKMNQTLKDLCVEVEDAQLLTGWAALRCVRDFPANDSMFIFSRAMDPEARRLVSLSCLSGCYRGTPTGLPSLTGLAPHSRLKK